MLRGIIFDMDGVLVDTEPFYHKRRIEYLTRHGVPLPPNMDFTGSNEKAIWESLIPHDIQLREKLKTGYRIYQKNCPAPYKDLLDPQVRPLFSELKRLGFLLAIASSSSIDIIQKIMDIAGIVETVDYCISGEECTAHKPDPEIYRRALSGLGISAEEAFAVEDSATGIAAAKNAGLIVYAFLPQQRKLQQDQSRADGQISHLLDILEIVHQYGSRQKPTAAKYLK